MKRVIFVIIITIFAMNYLYGQKLEPRENSNKKWGFVDETGKTVIPFKYDCAWNFHEGLARIGISYQGPGSCAGDFKKGFIDQTGKIVIPLKYDYIDDYNIASSPFSEEGLAVVSIGVKLGCEYDVSGGKWGYIDKTGKEIIPLKYDLAGRFSDGLAVVMLNLKWGFVNVTGKEVTSVFVHGAELTLGIAKSNFCEKAILCSLSPSCGETGITTKLLQINGIEVVNTF